MPPKTPKAVRVATLNRVDADLERIAIEHLNVGTLTTLNSDQLDFHTVAVWQVKAALRAALVMGLRAGAENPDLARLIAEKI